MSVKEVMTNLANAARARYSVSDTLTVSEITNLIYSENTDVAKLIDRTIDKIDVAEGVAIIGENAFRGCSQLTTVTLPRSIESIGDNAFADCSFLESVTCYFPKNIGGFPWGAPEEVFNFVIEPIEVEGGPLKFTARDGDTRITLNRNGGVDTSGIQYKTNNMSTFEYYDIGTEIVLENYGDFVLFQNQRKRLSNSKDSYVFFSSNKSDSSNDYPKVSGNLRSMIGGSDTATSFCFCKLFKNFRTYSNPLIPDIQLAPGCFYHMYENAYFVDTNAISFYGDPALAMSCYEGMFKEATVSIRLFYIPDSQWNTRSYYEFLKDGLALYNPDGYGKPICVQIEFDKWPDDSLECTTDWLFSSRNITNRPIFRVNRYLDKYIRDNSHIPAGGGIIPEGWDLQVETDVTCNVTTPVSIVAYHDYSDSKQLQATVSDSSISPVFYIAEELSPIYRIPVEVTKDGLFTPSTRFYESTEQSYEVYVYYVGDPLLGDPDIPHEVITVNVKYKYVTEAN